MRRALAVMAVTVSAALATPQVAAAAAQDRVTGHGVTTALFGAKVNAHSGPDGENPRGSFSVENDLGVKTQVRVTCMVVVGNTAVVGGVDADGFQRFVKVEDNGATGDRASAASSAQGTPDQLRCTELFAVLNQLFPVTGDFTVENA